MTYPITRQFGPNAKGSELSFTDMDNNLLYLDAKVTGSNNYITLFSGSSAISSSIIYQSGGNIGIGTTNPYTLFNVVGITTIGYPGVSSNSHLQFWPREAGGNAYYITDSGSVLRIGTGDKAISGADVLNISALNVGIGTDNPQAKFVISNNGAQGMEFGYSAALTSSYIESFNRATELPTDMAYYLGPGTGSHRFYTNGGQRMVINKDGAVGINNAAPVAALDVIGTTIMRGGDLIISSSYPRLYLTDTDSNSDFSIINDNGALNIYDDTNGASRIYISPSGNVGIGTISNVKLTVSGETVITGSTTLFNNEGTLNLRGTNSTLILLYPDNSTRRAYFGFSPSLTGTIILENEYLTGSRNIALVTNGGFVGINKYVPTSPLDVNGNAIITGSLTATGATTIGTTLTTGGKLGYGDSVGGIISQSVSRTTAVTLNSVCGRIKLTNAASTASYTSFTVNNNTVNQSDVIIVNASAGTAKYNVIVTKVQTSSFELSFAAVAGSATESPIFNFAVIKAGNIQVFPSGGPGV